MNGGEAASLAWQFENFTKAGTCKSVLSTFHDLCDAAGLKHDTHANFYRRLKSKINFWKAQNIWVKLDKHASRKEYRRGEACANTNVLVIGAGPCGLRTAIELVLLGARVVVVEKRDSFSRNNVLHLWPFLITDLKNLGAKKFFGKFCAGAIDHISIRQLQCILMKVALLLGVEIHVNTSFDGLIEPPTEQSHKTGWRAKITPEDSPVAEFEFDVLIGADGKRNTLQGFKRKEFRGKLAIAITANFINRNSQQEARVEEISGVAFIFNQKFFKDLNEKTGIDLENIVYYKDDTHYFVMTAKKSSLLDKGVLLQDHPDTATLLSQQNVCKDKLLNYAKEAADFSTNQLLPHLDYAINHYGQPDVAMFDFTSMFAAVNACRAVKRNGHTLLSCLVGDSLLEPFWPTGSGCARGFLGGFDAAWMVKNWASGKMTPLQVIAERESIYQVLSQTTPENLNKNYTEYGLDPNTRYSNMNMRTVLPQQVRHLYDTGDGTYSDEIIEVPAKRPRNDEYIDSYSLLRWCQRVLNNGSYRNVHVIDLTASWRSGLALCALIHYFKPDLIDFQSLLSNEPVQNNQLAFTVAESSLGIKPMMTPQEMMNCSLPDKLTMVSFLSQFYHKFKKERLANAESSSTVLLRDEPQKSHKSPLSRLSILQKLRNSAKFRSKKRKDKDEDKVIESSLSKRKHKSPEHFEKTEVELTKYNKLPMEEIANKLDMNQKFKDISNQNKIDIEGNVKVSAMAEILASKFQSQSEQAVNQTPVKKLKTPGVLLAAQPVSETCYFCKKRVYLMERMSAEGLFFHRGCLKCDYCDVGLRLNNYSADKLPTGDVKFFCFRHSRLEMRFSKFKRKRGYNEEEEQIKENIPKVVIDAGPSPKPERRTSPKKIPSPLTPPLSPPDDEPKPKKTPERIEFENSIDGLQEESEEELTEHNLRASMSSDALLLDMDDDLSDSDLEMRSSLKTLLMFMPSDDEELNEVLNETVGHSKDLTLEEALQVVETLKRKSHENLLDALKLESQIQYEKMNKPPEEEEESEADSDTEEHDDSTSETEKETDPSKDSEPSQQNGKLPLDINQANSPSAMKSARANFFNTAPEPVRLDPWKMFDMGNKTEEKKEEKKSESEEEEEEEFVEEEIIEIEEWEQIADEAEKIIKNVNGELSDEDQEENVHEDQEENEEENKQDTGDEFEEVFESDDENMSEGENDRTALKNEMEKLLADFDHKSSVSSGDHILKTDSSSVCDEELVMSDDNRYVMSEDNHADIECEEEDRVSINNSKRTSSNSSSKNTTQAVLESVRNMESSEENKDFTGIDDRFVTCSRGRGRNQTPGKKRYRNSFGSDSSFTISTPSNSAHSSLTSLSEDNKKYAGDDEREDDTPDNDLDDDIFRQYQVTISQKLDDDDEEYSEEVTPCVIDNLDDTLNAEKEIEMDNEQKEVDKSIYETPNASVTSDTFVSAGNSINMNNNYEKSLILESNELESCEKCISDGSVLSSDKNSETNDVTSHKRVISPQISSDGSEISNEQNVVSNQKKVIAPLINSDGSVWRPLPKLPDHLNKQQQKEQIYDNASPRKSSTSPKISKSKKLLQRQKKLPLDSEQSNNVKSSERKLITIDKSLELIKSPSKVIEQRKSVDDFNNDVQYSVNESIEKNLSVTEGRKLPDISNMKSRITPPGFQSEFMRKRLGSPTSSGSKTPSSPELTQSVSTSTNTPSVLSDTPDIIKDVNMKKTKISVDKTKLMAFNSIEDSSSQNEEGARKKIGVDVSLKKISPPVLSVEPKNIDNIPFADDSEDDFLEEKDQFYTPKTSVKTKPDNKIEIQNKDVRKRILPVPPTPSTPTADHIRELKKEEISKARENARLKARLKSDEELGLSDINYTPISAKKIQRKLRKELSTGTSNTPSTSDMVSDSEENKKVGILHSTPVNSVFKTPKSKDKKKKKKESIDIIESGLSKESDTETPSKSTKKKKSLLQILKPSKSPEHSKELKDKNRSSSTDTLEEKSAKKKKKTPKSEKKKKRQKSTDVVEMKDLPSVFSEKVKLRQNGSQKRPSLLQRRSMPPRADFDEFSDSDESHLSADASLNRRSKRNLTEDELNIKIARRVQSAARKQLKQKEQKRLRIAQEIQRQLEEVDVKQKELEERGVVVEKALRGEGEESGRVESELMQEWFNLVYEKNALVRYESELMVNAQYMELEDRHGRLEQELRERMAINKTGRRSNRFSTSEMSEVYLPRKYEQKTPEQAAEEKRILDELLEVVEEKNSLVKMIEEDRVREREEDRDLMQMMRAKGFDLDPIDHTRHLKNSCGFPLSC
ncbi:protein-methionine sulfoxide oxidase mical3b-like isoform X3 [Mytilus californianus]|uniref:protein-methionine sulfoxide oxidase mical3b-like isoform X3 n=1 Tax=Mytilus californianus TaxID=6549 RepID=UPI00224520F2|nr:protein-methionine sulfoxide oxidase mical3b-like isoform X3 [Mytilus californianus]